MKISKVKNNKDCETLDVDFESLQDIVSSTTWSPGVFKDELRNKSNFTQSEIIGLDFDEGTDLSSAIKMFNSFKHIIGTTKSHQKEKNGKVCDRFRVILFLAHPVYNRELYEGTVAKFLSDFPTADKACKDASRQFYPCTEIVSINQYGNLVNVDYSIFSTSLESEPLNFISDDIGEKITQLPKFVHNRLNNPPGSGEWHNKMIPVWKAFKAAKFDKQEAVRYISKHIDLDSGDLKQIDYAYQNNNWEMELSDAQLKGKKLSRAQRQDIVLEKVYEILDSSFIVVADEQNRRRPLKICNNNEVQETDIDTLVGLLISTFRGSEYLDTFGNIKQFVKSWMYATDTDVHTSIPAVAFPDTNHYTYKRLSFQPKKGATPLFDRIMNNVNNSEAMMAFIWSLLEPKSYKQQVVWWYGLGGDGKGSVSRVLQRVFGKAYIGTSSQDQKSNPSFFTSNLVGKRIAIFSDENNGRLLMTGWFKQLTGDDVIGINPKGDKGYSTKLDLKIMVFSNRPPEFDNTKAHMRRIIYCTPKDTLSYEVDPKFEEKLCNEIPAILYKCREKYNELAVDHGPIECDMEDAVEVGKIKDHTKFEFLRHNFETGKNCFILREDLQNFVLKSLEFDDSYNDFKQFLSANNLIKEKKVMVDGIRKNVYYGIRLKGK